MRGWTGETGRIAGLWRAPLVAATLTLGLVEARAAVASEPVHDQVRLEDPRDAMVVGDAILGALRRLDDARCRAVFADFRDAEGRPLQHALDARQETPQERLRRVQFRDGGRRGRCRPPSPIAFTTPGSLVVYICGREFRAAAERSRIVADAVILHELLHTLGLGENPPKPKEITDSVVARCGR